MNKTSQVNNTGLKELVLGFDIHELAPEMRITQNPLTEIQLWLFLSTPCTQLGAIYNGCFIGVILILKSEIIYLL